MSPVIPGDFQSGRIDGDNLTFGVNYPADLEERRLQREVTSAFENF
ncbi:MAG: hypothetical protein ACE5PV_03220 [Candidatus Poribacteria bacterium]